MERTRIFSKRFETTYLYLLGAALFMALLSFCQLLPASLLEFRWFHFLMTVVFLDAIHVVFTMITVFGLPEFRTWFFQTLKTSRALFIVPMVLGIAILGYLQLGDQDELSTPVAIAIAALTLATSSVHSIKQARGLSLMYNMIHKPKLQIEEIEKQLRVEKLERLLFSAMVFLLVVDRIQNLYPVLHISTRTPYLALSVLCAGVIYLNCFRYPKIQGSNKPYFLSGVLLLPMTLYFPMIALIQKVLHGFEYAFLSYDMGKRSAVKTTRAWILAVVLTLAAQTLLESLWGHYISRKRWMPTSLIAPMLFMHFFLMYFHFYMDGLIFKFSDPTVRQALVPVILPSNEEIAPVGATDKQAA